VTRAVLLACAVLALLAALFAFKISAKMPDFEVYWRSAIRAAAGEPLYRAEDGHYQFKYLPAAAVLAIPIGALPLAAAEALWFGVSCALVAALIALSIALLPARRKPRWYLAVVTTVAMAKFFGHELVLGQANLLLATLAVGGVYLLRRERDAYSGALVALAVIVKPYALILVPWLGARPRAAIAAASGIAAALILPAALYGFDGNVAQHRAWWTAVANSTAPNLLNPDNVSLAAMYAKWIGPGGVAAGLAGATALVLLATAGVVFARRGNLPFPECLEAALLLTLMPLLSPQGWDYVFLVSTPAIVLLANYEDRLPAPLRALTIAAVATIAFSLFDVMGRRAYAAFMSVSAISVCFLVVIVALCALRLRRVA
jgi:hypothetical protein